MSESKSENPAIPPPLYQLYCGVDIAARSFTASVLKWQANVQAQPDKASSYAHNEDAYLEFQQALLEKEPKPALILIVMEATGNYWISLATFLHRAGFAVAVINPSQSHDFAKLLLRRSKNDQLDAQNLAQLAATLKPAIWTPPPTIYYELQQRLTHRDSLLDLRQQVRNQLHALSVCPVIIESVQLAKEQLVETLNKQLKTVEKEIEGLRKGSDEWAKSVVLLQTIPGVGLVTACWIVVVTLNLTACPSAEALVSYAGLAPRERSSGTSVRGRPAIGQGGNSRLRTAAFMATLSAVRYNPVLKEFYERLKKEKGKPDRVARCAVARKLLHFAYAIVKKGEAFDPEFVVNQTQKKLAKSA